MIFDIDNGNEGFVHTEYDFNNENKITDMYVFSRRYNNKNNEVKDNMRTTNELNIEKFEFYLPSTLAEMDTADFKYAHEKVSKQIRQDVRGINKK